MAVIGHWFAPFALCALFPQVPIALAMKCSMLSDGLALFFILFGMEGVYAYAPWMGPAPPETLAAIRRWKARGEWDTAVDLEPYDGTSATASNFHGFEGAFPFYMDVTYTHSVTFMAIVACIISALWAMLTRETRGDVGSILTGALVLFLCTISHPALDMLFHDAYVLHGNRTVTREAFLDHGLWQNVELSAVALVLELCLAVLPYMMWRCSRLPIDATDETAAAIRRSHRHFWAISLCFNLPSIYLLTLGMHYVLWPIGYRFGVLGWRDATSVWLWCFAILPVHRIETLTMPRGPHAKPSAQKFSELV